MDSEATLMRAKAEADAWDRGSATVQRVSAQMPAAQVQAVVAERNTLRVALREAEAQVRAVERAGGGSFVSLVRMCQDDMERLSRLRTTVEREHAHLEAARSALLEETEELKRQLKAADLRVETSEEELAERAETILGLQAKVEELEGTLLEAGQEYERRIHQAVETQHRRMLAEAEADKDAALRRLEATLKQERHDALAEQRAEIEAMAEARLQTRLSEQQHSLVAQAHRERSAELQALQQELQEREARNMEALRHQLKCEHERAAGVLEQRLHTVQARAAAEQEELRERHQAELENALEEQHRRLDADATREKDAALKMLEVSLTTQHAATIEDLKATLGQRHHDELAAQVKRATDHQGKRLNSAHATEKSRALREQHDRLTSEHGAAMQELTARLEKRHQVALETKLKKSGAALSAKAERESARARAEELARIVEESKVERLAAVESARSRLQAQAETDQRALKEANRALAQEVSALRQEKALGTEGLQANFRAEKTEALDVLRKRMEAQHQQDIQTLRSENARLRSDLEELRRGVAAEGANTRTHLRAERVEIETAITSRLKAQHEAKENSLKAAAAELRDENARLSEEVRELQREGQRKGFEARVGTAGLRDALRRLLNDMKIALVPRVNAPLDTSASTPSKTMGALQVLIRCLGLKVPDLTPLEAPSQEATAAPPVATDILLGCAMELAHYLNAANEEIVAMGGELIRDRRAVKHAAEEELRQELSASIQVVGYQQRSLAPPPPPRTKPDPVLQRKTLLADQAISEAADLRAALADAEQQNGALREEMVRMQEEFNKTKFLNSPSPSSRTGTASDGSSAADHSDGERALQEMERLRLERQIASLQADAYGDGE